MTVDLHHEGRTVRALAERLRELCGDDDQAFADTLDGETTAIDAARAVVRQMREWEASEAANKALADSYAGRARLFAERQERARTALLHFMGDLGAKTLPLPEATLSIAKGTPSLAGEADPADLPDALVRVKREPNRSAIKAALERGETVPGYSLSNAAPRLTVRVR